MTKRKDLCELQDDFSSLTVKSSTLSGNGRARVWHYHESKAVKKARLSCILTVIHWLVTILSLHLGYWIQKLEVVTSELKPILAVTNIFSIIFWSFLMSSFLPGFILCAQMSCNLMKSTEEIFMDDVTTRVKLRNTVRFSKEAEKTSKLLSPIYLHLSLCAFVPLTLRIYQLLDFGLIGSSSPHVLIYVGIVTDIIGNGLGTNWILNIQSEDMKQKFKDVKKEIHQLVTSPSGIHVEINGNDYPEEDARKIVLKMLDEFHGFDANGFFNLGKPFLVNVFATVVISYALLLTEFHFSTKL